MTKHVEEKTKIILHGPAQCPIVAAIGVFGGKWKPLIIRLLLSGPTRFGDLHKSMDGVALKVLSRHLKELESDGIVARKVFPEVPPHVEYSLTEKGESLSEVMGILSDWSREHILGENPVIISKTLPKARSVFR